MHIKPIISDRCFKCHGPDNGAREADLYLNTQEGLYAALASDPLRHVIIPGDASSSEMVSRITSDDPDIKMPPEGSNLSLTDHEKALITRSIDQGAEWKPHWAFIPPKSCLGGCGSIDGFIPFVEWTNNLIQFLRKYELGKSFNIIFVIWL